MKTASSFRIVSLLVGVLFAGLVSAQTLTVRGTVSDPNGEPLIGAAILAVGTTNGTITDFDGNYVLDNVAGTATLEFSYMGLREAERRWRSAIAKRRRGGGTPPARRDEGGLSRQR